MNPLFRLLPSGWGAVLTWFSNPGGDAVVKNCAKLHEMSSNWFRKFLILILFKTWKKTFLYVAAVISFISTANDLENPLHFDEKLLN